MGISMLKRCYTNPQQPAPMPNPTEWALLDKKVFSGGYVLKVRYFHCTNFEGVKVMVFRGAYRDHIYLDPHFEPTEKSPIARFAPNDDGWRMAIELASHL
jgi:hypothetical protein